MPSENARRVDSTLLLVDASPAGVYLWVREASDAGQIDPKSHHILIIGTEQRDPPAPGAKNPRLRPVLSTFELLQIGK